MLMRATYLEIFYKGFCMLLAIFFFLYDMYIIVFTLQGPAIVLLL